MKKTLNKNLKIRINFVTWFLRRLPHFSAPHRSPDQSIIAIGTQPFTSPSLSLLLIGWLSHWPQWSTYRSTPAGPLSVGPLVAEISNRLGRLVPWIPSQINVSDVGRRERGENSVLLQVRRVFRKLKTKELNHNHVSATSSLLFFEQIFFSDRKLWFSSSIHEKHCVSQQDQLQFSLFPCLNLVFPSNPFFLLKIQNSPSLTLNMLSCGSAHLSLWAETSTSLYGLWFEGVMSVSPSVIRSVLPACQHGGHRRVRLIARQCSRVSMWPLPATFLPGRHSCLGGFWVKWTVAPCHCS